MKYLLAILLSIAMAEPLGAAKLCECGSHATFITAYTVSSGGCCDGAASAGLRHYYSPDAGGGDVWVWSHSVMVSGSTAQGDCCSSI